MYECCIPRLGRDLLVRVRTRVWVWACIAWVSGGLKFVALSCTAPGVRYLFFLRNQQTPADQAMNAVYPREVFIGGHFSVKTGAYRSLF